MPKFIASCAKGLEYLLVDELKSLGAIEPKEGLSQVQFESDWQGVYQILMWSRVASRILYPIARFEALDDDTLYQQCSIVDWSQHLSPGSSFVVNAQSYRSNMSHSQFIAQRVKDAVVDYFREESDQRPDVEFDRPDVVLHCRVRRNQVTLSIDLAGIGLHQRGYRLAGGGAPIKENLAAALLMRAGWPDSNGVIYDPMCGSGTFLIESAMMALDIAPGIAREYLGLFGWQQFDSSLWQQTLDAAIERREQGKTAAKVTIMGSDINPKAVRNAQSNVSLAGLEDFIKVQIAGIDQLEQFDLPQQGLIMVNPPYSERLGERTQVKHLYTQLGDLLKQKFHGWRASVLSADKEFGHALSIRAKKIYKFNNGSIPCELLNLELRPENYIQSYRSDKVDADFAAKLSEQAIQLKNRIEKNRAKLKKFLNKENISCYRIYDADLPEYNAAIDVYADKLHIQEYRAPKSVDEKTAARRLKDIERVAAGVFQIPLDQVYTKQRRRQKGDWQYQVNKDDEKASHYFQVEEGGRQFIVNLQDYLDTGLFLDHRNTRALVAKLAAGKRFLNLFCYTASVSVYAATAGASSTTNVDMSRTYLDWAKKNFDANKLKSEKHQFLREDCVAWIEQQQHSTEQYDLIFLDPPTFSNSKKMQEHLDVQADHVELIDQCMSLLAPGGKLIFSNNFQKFEMAYQPPEGIAMKEITRQTQSIDFNRHGLHRCWLIEK